MFNDLSKKYSEALLYFFINKTAYSYNGAFVVISHDRAFLTKLTKQTLWLDRSNIRRAEIGFGGFDAWMEQIYAEETRAAEKLDAKLKIEAHWLEYAA